MVKYSRLPTMASKDEEKQGLTKSFKSQMGYGTAVVTAASKKLTPRTQKFINRKLAKTDTLQGISLRYGVTVQDLKRENRLYTNDSLFLRETLLIPLTNENEANLGPDDEIVVVDGPTDKLLSGKSGASPRAPPTNDGDAPGSPAVLHVLNEISGTTVESDIPGRSISDPISTHVNGASLSGHSSSLDVKSTSASSLSSTTSTSSSRVSTASHATDFFSKYDKNIAYLKGEIAKLESNATNLDGLVESNPLALPPSRKGSQSSTSGWVSYQVEDDESNGAPVLLIRSRTNSRQIKSTLERSQQASDDLFEL